VGPTYKETQFFFTPTLSPSFSPIFFIHLFSLKLFPFLSLNRPHHHSVLCHPLLNFRLPHLRRSPRHLHHTFVQIYITPLTTATYPLFIHSPPPPPATHRNPPPSFFNLKNHHHHHRCHCLNTHISQPSSSSRPLYPTTVVATILTLSLLKIYSLCHTLLQKTTTTFLKILVTTRIQR